MVWITLDCIAARVVSFTTFTSESVFLFSLVGYFRFPNNEGLSKNFSGSYKSYFVTKPL